MVATGWWWWWFSRAFHNRGCLVQPRCNMHQIQWPDTWDDSQRRRHWDSMSTWTESEKCRKWRRSHIRTRSSGPPRQSATSCERRTPSSCKLDISRLGGVDLDNSASGAIAKLYVEHPQSSIFSEYLQTFRCTSLDKNAQATFTAVFPRDVQRKILRSTTSQAKPLWNKLVISIHDENAQAVQLEVGALLLETKQVEGCASGTNDDTQNTSWPSTLNCNL